MNRSRTRDEHEDEDDCEGRFMGSLMRLPKISTGREMLDPPRRAAALFNVSSRPALATIGDLGQSARVKVREIVRRIEDDGWYWVRTRGSHHQYRHRTRRGLVTVPGRPGDDLAPGTLSSIVKQAGLK
jgi:predicted RNA binding protein YcfA (HicA-like mRNA interferase family)